MNGIILPLYKGKGNKQDCNNYRGITLLSCVGKLFTSILNERLSYFIESNNILSENQAGFRKGHSTLDHAFILKTLIDIYASQNHKLFCACVDFKKAFDSVWRQGLWTKLIQQGINGKVLLVITNLYKNIKSCVFLNDEKSDYFSSYKGVRQGENLSPVLFSLYLNDIEQFFVSNNCSPLNIELASLDSNLSDYIKLFLLLYADDTILFSDSRDGLQKALDVLYSYCIEWKLEVNPTKTKVIVFNKRKNPRDTFRYGNNNLDTVNSFSYLGIEFSRTGTFHKSKKRTFDKAQKAIFVLMQIARNQKLPIGIVLELYQSMILPILLYGCEIWGYENNGILEKLQLKFLKHVLRLNRSTYSQVIYGETGLYPISVHIKMRMVRFWCDIKSSEKYSSKLYNILYRLHTSGICTSKWIESIRNIFIETGYDCVWDTQTFQDRESLCKDINMELKNNFERLWRQELEQSSKCLFYRHYKQEFKREKYISQLPDKYVYSLCKFRCSNHRLPIEIGRRQGLDRKNRICQKCNMKVVGDEFHFVMECPSIDNIRNQLISSKFSSPKSVFNFCKLFTANRKTQLNLSKFIVIGGALK